MHTHKSIIFTTFLIAFGLLLHFASAAPPACVLACVNEEPDVSDLKVVCTSAEMTSCLPSKCSDVQAAFESYKATCSAAGYKVDDLVTSTSAKPSATASSTSFSTVTRSSAYPTVTSAGNATAGNSTAGNGIAGSSNSTVASSLNSAGQVVFQTPLVVIVMVASFFAL